MKKFLAYPVTRALLALVIIVILGTIFNADGAFFDWGTHRDMLRQVSVYGILACGMTLVIITGGIDLSVGSVLGLTSVFFSMLSIHWGWSPWVTIPLSLLLGAGCGMISGGFIARFGLQPFIVTLAMMVFARGMAKYVSGGQKISNYLQKPDGSFENLELPAVFDALDARLLGNNVTVVSVILGLSVAVSYLVLNRHRYGRYLFAIGGNEAAAALSGVPVLRAKLLAYGISGMFAALAGICQAAQEYQGDPEAGTAYELSAIAIVVIGGTSLMGGRGGIMLTLLGTLTIGYLEKILSLNAVGEASRLMLTGAIIVGAVMFQRNRAN
ncbi:MAG: ABC transporter permease [Candidatus Hydrogenedentes bacterium]|nr:ABC transporter permease [Candidatus Hydrogenedentota bacterium]